MASCSGSSSSSKSLLETAPSFTSRDGNFELGSHLFKVFTDLLVLTFTEVALELRVSPAEKAVKSTVDDFELAVAAAVFDETGKLGLEWETALAQSLTSPEDLKRSVGQELKS